MHCLILSGKPYFVNLRGYKKQTKNSVNCYVMLNKNPMTLSRQNVNSTFFDSMLFNSLEVTNAHFR